MQGSQSLSLVWIGNMKRWWTSQTWHGIGGDLPLHVKQFFSYQDRSQSGGTLWGTVQIFWVLFIMWWYELLGIFEKTKQAKKQQQQSQTKRQWMLNFAFVSQNWASKVSAKVSEKHYCSAPQKPAEETLIRQWVREPHS